MSKFSRQCPTATESIWWGEKHIHGINWYQVGILPRQKNCCLMLKWLSSLVDVWMCDPVVSEGWSGHEPSPNVDQHEPSPNVDQFRHLFENNKSNKSVEIKGWTLSLWCDGPYLPIVRFFQHFSWTDSTFAPKTCRGEFKNVSLMRFEHGATLTIWCDGPSEIMGFWVLGFASGVTIEVW